LTVNAASLKRRLTLFPAAPLVQMAAPLQLPRGVATGTLVYVRTPPTEFRSPAITAFVWAVESFVGSAKAMSDSAMGETATKTNCFKTDALQLRGGSHDASPSKLVWPTSDDGHCSDLPVLR
jgi:hypothetical protein